MSIIGLHFFNDLKQQNGDEVLEKVQSNTHLSFSFIALLVGSSIITTLGLLLNSPPIVIGGMIISPLMWPLVKIGLGVSYGQTWYIKHALVLLTLSIIVTVFCSSLITFLSPIKSLTTEILARTSPTLLDLIIAIVAGAIAALAITRPRISDSLAGVAIATALTPPLCAVGIGLALMDFDVFSGSFLLFFTNVISIVFIATVMFHFIGIKKESESFFTIEWVVILVILLILTSIPLYYILKNYTLQTATYSTVQEVLKSELKNISPSSSLEGITTDVAQEGRGNILIEADVLLPQDTIIDYTQRQQIVDALEKALGKRIDLRLRLQSTLDIVKEEDIEDQNLKQSINEAFVNQIRQLSSSLSIDSMDITLPETIDKPILIASVLRGDPTLTLTTKQLDSIEENLSILIDRPVSIQLEIVPRARLKSEPELEQDQMRQSVENLLSNIAADVEVESLTLSQNAVTDNVNVSTVLRVSDPESITDEEFEFIKQMLRDTYNREFTFSLHIIQQETVRF